MTTNYQRWHQLYDKYKDHTMVWEPWFWDNLDLCLRHHKPGMSVVECGVWKGGMMGAIAEALADESASYHLFDSFEGLPDPQPVDGQAALDWQKDTGSASYYNNCKADLEDAQRAMSLAGAINVTYHKGWYDDTLKGFESDAPLSILRLDSDWYASTLQCLEALYPMVAPGGVIIVDDYYVWDGCAKAVHDYLSKNSLSERIEQTAHKVAFLVKK